MAAAKKPSASRKRGRTRKAGSPAKSIPEEVKKGARFPFTDDGNACRFAEDHKGTLIYVTGPGWYRWTGRYWRSIPDENVLKDARRTARKIYIEGEGMNDPSAIGTALGWAKRSAGRGRLEAMVKLAQGGDDLRHADIKVEIDDLDRNPDILNTPTGIVDLRTGILLEPSLAKAERCTRITRVPYDPDADQSAWKTFLGRVVPDRKLRAALQLCTGASLTGHVPKALFALVGASGNNGKTQFVEAVSAVLGTYADTAMESTFTNASARDAGYVLAELRGARFVAFAETRQGHGLAAERVKRLTGGDMTTARSPYGKPFSYRSEFSLWMATNHPPVIPARENALWNRIWLFPFEVVVPKAEQIPDLGSRLVQDHGSGILTWLIEGATKFYEQDRKLGRQPKRMAERRTKWQERDDIVQRWLDERTEPAPRRRTRFPVLWNDFHDWCIENGERGALDEYTAQTFHGEMDDHYSRGDTKLEGSFTRVGVIPRRASSV